MLKKSLWALLALIFALAVAVAFYAWRALPQLDGTLSIQGLSAEVLVRRDDADVTHIQARSPQDAWFALGFVHAQERGWQLAFNRRLMHGQLSEVLGPATLELDKLLRTLDIAGAAQRQYRGLPAHAQEALQRYSAGIGAFHAQSPQALSPEFHLLGVKPGDREPPWTPEDSVGWALMMALDLGGNWGHEYARLSLLQVLDTQRLWELMPPYPGEAPLSSVDLAQLYRSLGVYTRHAPEPRAEWSRTVQDAWALWAQDWVRNAGTHEGKGSNNWALAGPRTTSGKPLLANDPHLGLSAPAIWYFASLQAPAGRGPDGHDWKPLKVIGATLPGLPFVVLGRTPGVAWAFTNTGPDVQDLYIERIRPDQPEQYQTPTGWAPFQSRTETIRVKGHADVVFKPRNTRHGPVISDAVSSHAEVLDLSRHVLSLRFSALSDDNRGVLAGLLANTAQDVDSVFEAFAHHHSPMQSALAADVQGHIRMRAIGQAPVRRADNDLRGVAPAPGWMPQYDWQGWRATTDLPQDLGERHWMATANQRIEPPGRPDPLTQDWILPYRYQRIEQQLLARAQHDMASMRELQNDVKSEAMLRLWPHLLQSQAQHPLAAAAMAALQGFDGHMRADQAAPLIGAVWADELARGLISPRIGEARFKALYGKRDFRAGLEGMLERNDLWWCGQAGCQAASSRALERALDRIAGVQGQDVGRWRWGQVHAARSAHRPLGQVAALARWFNVQVPSAGDGYTVNVGQYHANEADGPFMNRHAASLRALYDLSDPEQSVFIYQTGQSGVVHDPRYRNMASEWAAGQYRPLQFNPPRWAHELKLTP
jgi:penicillin G amidase